MRLCQRSGQQRTNAVQHTALRGLELSPIATRRGRSDPTIHRACPKFDRGRMELTARSCVRPPISCTVRPPMSPVEALVRHAAECKRMAERVSDAPSRFVWIGMAERWLRCAEIYESERTSAESNRKAKLRRRFAGGSFTQTTHR